MQTVNEILITKASFETLNLVFVWGLKWDEPLRRPEDGGSWVGFWESSHMNNVWAGAVLCYLLCMESFHIKDGGTWYGFLYQMKIAEQGRIYSLYLVGQVNSFFSLIWKFHAVELFIESWQTCSFCLLFCRQIKENCSSLVHTITLQDIKWK